MSSHANYFKLGLFVIGGTMSILGALLALGIGRSSSEPLLVETYLDQSVQGLDTGSKVRFRGVEFGTVHAIGFARQRYQEGKPVEQQDPYVVIDVAVSEDMFGDKGRPGFLEFMRAEVKRGLRFRLNVQGITGLSYLELDYVDPERYPPLAVPWTPEHPYIPSAPGTIRKLLTSVETVFRKLEDADLGLVLTNLNRLLTTTEGEIRNVDLTAIGRQATNLLAELRASNQALKALLENPRWSGVISNASETLQALHDRIQRLDTDGIVQRLDRTLANAEGFLAGKEADLASILANLRVLSENLRAVSELARSHPAGLLLGAPPKPVQPER